jgi:hypothetical protein
MRLIIANVHVMIPMHGPRAMMRVIACRHRIGIQTLYPPKLARTACSRAWFKTM